MKALVVPDAGFDGTLLAGPAVRAVSTGADHVTLLCDPVGAAAAELLPHVDAVVVRRDDAPAVADPDGTAAEDALVDRLRDEAYDVALVLTGHDEGPLPLARLLRRADVARIGAAGTGGPDGPLDVRHRRLPGRHEAEVALDLAAVMGFAPRTGDDGRLRVLPAPDTATLTGNGPYVVVHPGSAAGPQDVERCAEAVDLLADAGHRVVVTDGPGEPGPTRRVGGATAVDLGGRTNTRTLAGVFRAADVLVTGATGPAQLAAGVGTPVLALSSPAEHRVPYRVPALLLDGGTAQDVVRGVQKLMKAHA
ncbi:glycosyltransferase family 9 protein [Streptomyces sp. DH24]|uniref:glycosyltransferase family 9 protein n=1 Tax=Streptomyces sp. DH24 TaxID=3040123 RepID=UPI002441E3B0|nr:glycosyltransferase family 9 protein [Streptomyces sp. DH24]MDG9719883.1 glycosyltransferase family 9 protein [Streptomyces sp. DH24]